MIRAYPKPLNQKQRGVALIIVLMIVALVSVLGTEMGARLQLQISRASNIKDNNQAFWYAMGAEEFAKKSIVELYKRNNSVTSLEGNWSEEFTFPLEGGGIQAQLIDMQTCFNLNGIRKGAEPPGGQNQNQQNQSNQQNTIPKGQQDPLPGTLSQEAQAFERLLTSAVPTLDNYDVEVVTHSLVDWLDDNDTPEISGAEDAEYASLVNPYLTANTFMVNKTELRMVKGVQPGWINALMPYVCAIPNQAELRLNINTLTEEQAPVLAAMLDINQRDAQSLISNRKPSGYDDINDFLAEPVVTGRGLTADRKNWFTITTEYFLLRTKTRYNDASFNMITVFKNQNGDVSVVRREFTGAI